MNVVEFTKKLDALRLRGCTDIRAAAFAYTVLGSYDIIHSF